MNQLDFEVKRSEVKVMRPIW